MKTRTQISVIVASAILTLLLCIFSYASAPESATFWEAMNPLSAIAGLLFTLCYIGLSVWLGAVVLIAIIAGVWMVLFAIVRTR